MRDNNGCTFRRGTSRIMPTTYMRVTLSVRTSRTCRNLKLAHKGLAYSKVKARLLLRKLTLVPVRVPVPSRIPTEAPVSRDRAFV